MLDKLKARFIGGIYFQELIIALVNIFTRKYSLWDRYAFYSYFIGNGYAINKIYKALELKYSENNCFNFSNIYLPKMDDLKAKGAFIGEFFDFLYPVLNRNFARYTGEGPYLYKNVQINKDDIIIDAGANIGMFSALASSKGAIVYAFEPVEYIREKYLDKTAQLNPNIHIVPLALSNKNGFEDMEITIDNIGGSSIIIKRANSVKEQVQTITLDDWVKRNNVPRVDFIKADIEGAEKLMLEGAQWVLKTFAPKLAICTYHLPDDKEVLTKLILKANPNYKIEYAWKKLYAIV